MGCYTSCVVAAALIVGNVAVWLQGERTVHRAHFLEILGPKLKAHYHSVVAERRTLYYTGLGWGLVIAGLVSYTRAAGRRPFHVGCMAAAITLGTAYFYYALMPKRRSMLPRLDTEEQRRAWQAVYRGFQRHYIVGMILGGLGGAFLGAGVCR
jgi:hypothetical protein